jgi:hypothetical protein
MKLRPILTVGVVGAVAFATGAAAQDIDPERQSVLERGRPDYDALGIRAGSFLIFPSLALREIYDSNIFAVEDNARSDLVTVLQPAVRIASDWNVHAVSLETSGDLRRYLDNSTEDNDNFAVSGSGRLDILRDIYLQGGLAYRLLHEDRGSPDDRGGVEPTPYAVSSASLSYVHQPLRLGYRLDATVDAFDYDNVATGTGGIINNDDRDRTIYTVAPRATYEIVPGYRAFARFAYNLRRYGNVPGADGIDRNSDGYQIDIGTDLDLGRIITGEIFVGYLHQTYDDARLSSVSGVSFGGSLLWNVTALTSVRGVVARTVEETVVIGASSYLQTAFRLGVEHELLRNVLLSADASYINSDYQGSGRSDEYYELSGGARYLLNRYLSAGIDVTGRSRASSVSGSDYDRVLIAARIRAQL